MCSRNTVRARVGPVNHDNACGGIIRVVDLSRLELFASSGDLAAPSGAPVTATRMASVRV
jgi:hypothetical protein